MKQSVRNALDTARGALYAQQSEVLREITRIQRSIDAAVAAKQEPSSYDTELLATYKVKLADTVLARENLFCLELDAN